MISLEASALLEPGSPHGSTPTSPSFNVAPAARQPQLRSTRPETPVQNLALALDSPPNVPFVEYLRQWSDQHVARWLADCKCAHHGQTFANHDIRGDILLDLDQQTLREMGIASVGDRIKILNGVKTLRNRCSKTKTLAEPLRLPVKLHDSAGGDSLSTIPPRNTLKRLESGRPPPLHLTSSSSRDLPQLIRTENSRSNTTRPLPHPHGHTHTHSSSSVKDINGNTRGLPPLPPPPKAQPPAPPLRLQPGSANASAGGSRNNLLPPQHLSGRRTPTPIEPPPSFTKDPLPPAPAAPGTPSTTGAPWTGEYGLPRGPSPGNLGGRHTPTTAGRSTSPLPPPRSRAMALAAGATHNRSGSAANQSHHPYAAPSSVQAALQPPPNPVVGALSPIAESFMSQHNVGNSTPSPPTAGPSSSSSQSYPVGRGPFRPTTPSGRAPMSAEAIRRKCVKFILADDGHSRVVNVEDIPRGAEVLEHVLRKFGKFGGIGFPSIDPDNLDFNDLDEGLVVDGWGVFLDDGLADSPGEYPVRCFHMYAHSPCRQTPQRVRAALHLSRRAR